MPLPLHTHYIATGYPTQQPVQQAAAYGTYAYPQQAAATAYPTGTVAYSATTSQPTQQTSFSTATDQSTYGATQWAATTVSYATQTSQPTAGYVMPSQTAASTGSIQFSCSLASQPHSVPKHRLLPVSARGGRVWRLRTTLQEQLERNYWISHA